MRGVCFHVLVCTPKHQPCAGCRAKVCIEGVDVVDLGELLDDLGELLVVGGLAELDLHVSAAAEAGPKEDMDMCW